MKAELRAMTKSHGSRAIAVVISSTMPSAKYSCSGSPDMFWNGSTASDGLSGRCSRQRRARRCAESDSIGTHGSCDVLDLLLAEIVEGEVEAVAHLLVRRGTEANPAGLGQGFEPGGNVDAIAEDVAILDDDVTDIDAHAKFDAALCRSCGVAGDHLALQLDRTAHRVDNAGKLRKEAVASRFDDAAAMLGDFGIAEFTANRTQCRERALFVLAHQPRIAGDIGRQ